MLTFTRGCALAASIAVAASVCAIATPAAAQAPDAPGNVAAGPLIQGAVVSWTAPAGFAAGSLSYDVYLGPNATSLAKVATTSATSQALTGLHQGSAYDVAVLARTADGQTSAMSSPVGFTPSTAELVVALTNGEFDLGRASLTPGTPADLPLDIPGAGMDATSVAASPNGMRIAYAVAPHNGSTTDEIWVANRDGSNPIRVASGPNIGAPAWSPDGTELVFGDAGALARIDPAAGAAIGGLPNSSGLGGATWAGPHTLIASDLSTTSGPLVVLDTQTGARHAIANSAGGAFAAASPGGTAVAYTAAGALWVSTLAGARHQVALPAGSSGATSIAWSRDQSRLYVASAAYGNQGEVWSTLAAGGGTPVEITALSPTVPMSVALIAPDTTPPAVSVPKLPAVALTPSITLRYSARDNVNGIRSYDVRYTHATTTYRYPEAAVNGGTATTATSLTIHLFGGVRYCFYVRATDNAGNVSPWSRPVCTTAPYDDRALAKSAGFAAATGSAFYRGTVYTTTQYGAEAWMSSNTHATYLVATTCASCGSVEILQSGHRVGVISLYSASTMYRRVLAIPRSSYSGTSFVVRVVTHGKRVLVDGVIFPTV